MSEINYQKSERLVPELSLLQYVSGNASDRHHFVDQLFRGLKEYGFIILVDHIVKQSEIQEAYQLSSELFALPAEKKLSMRSPGGGGQRGYTAFGTEHSKDSPYPDLKEFWHVGREVPPQHRFAPYYPPNIWPTGWNEFQKVMSNLYRDMEETSRILLEAVGVALDVPQGFFDEMIFEGNSILRLIHYPAIPEGANPKSVRAAPHADINLITLLVGATDSGLELLDRDGSWLAVNSKINQIVVDSGDMLSRITNEIIPSTIHRVVNPQNSKKERYSMPFFVHPHPHTNLTCLPSCVGSGRKYPDINSHQYLQQRLKEIGLSY